MLVYKQYIIKNYVFWCATVAFFTAGVDKVEGIRATKGYVSPKLDLSASQEPESNHPCTTASPKIQGVRVTINAGNIEKSMESGRKKESAELNYNKTCDQVGFRTDVSFEITETKNKTSFHEEDIDENASVPIFKGRTTTRKPTVNEGWSSSPLPMPRNVYPGVEGGDHDKSHYPKFYTPSAHRNHNENAYGNIDSLSNISPIRTFWTTERSYHPTLKPKPVVGLRDFYHEPKTFLRRWKPCLCSDDGLIWRDEVALTHENYRQSNMDVRYKYSAPSLGK